MKPSRKWKSNCKSFTQNNGTAYTLVPLPMCEAKYNEEGNRLPATYANFLITNDALVYPTYNDINDKKVGALFKTLFPGQRDHPRELSETH